MSVFFRYEQVGDAHSKKGLSLVLAKLDITEEEMDAFRLDDATRRQAQDQKRVVNQMRGGKRPPRAVNNELNRHHLVGKMKEGLEEMTYDNQGVVHGTRVSAKTRAARRRRKRKAAAKAKAAKARGTNRIVGM